MTKKLILYTSIIVFIILNIIICFNINNYVEVLNKCFSKEIVLDNFYYATICIIFAVISVLFIIAIKLIVFYKKEEIRGINLKSEDGTYGTADWVSNEEVNKILGKNDVAGIILGKKENNIIKLPFDSFFNKNIAVFGSSGSMKTIGFLITNLLELLKYKKSIIVTDAKGEIYRKTNTIFRENGYIVKVFNLKDMEHSDRWNPFGENENLTDIQTSSNVIITGTQKKKGKDDFWPRAEENLLRAFEIYFLENKVERNTLAEAYRIIASGDIERLDNMFRSLPLDSPARM